MGHTFSGYFIYNTSDTLAPQSATLGLATLTGEVSVTIHSGSTYDPGIAGTYTPAPAQDIQIYFADNTNAAFSDVATLPASYNLAQSPGHINLGANVGTPMVCLGYFFIAGNINSLTVTTHFKDGFETSN